MTSKVVKEVAKKRIVRPPPTHGVKITSNYNKMRQYGHIQGNSVLLGYHPLQDEILNLYKGDKAYIYGVSKLSLLWNSKGTGNTGARYFKYDKMPPLMYWNPDVKFQITKKLEGNPSLTLEMKNGTVKELDITNKKADEIYNLLMETVNSVAPNKDRVAAKAFVDHWSAREKELIVAEKETVKVPDAVPAN